VKANVSKYKRKATFDALESEVDSLFYSIDKERVAEKELLEALRVLASEGEIALFGDKHRPFFKLAKDNS